MGNCGCASVDRIEKAFWIEEGETVLAIHIYKGCPYCKTPVEVDFYAIDADVAEDDWMIDLEDLSPLAPGEDIGFSVNSVSIFDPHKLGEADFGDDGLPLMENYDNLSDWLDDNGYRLIENAIYRHDDWKEPFRRNDAENNA